MRLHHDNPLRQVDSFIDVVRDKDDRNPSLLPQFYQVMLQRRARDRIDSSERLIHQEYPRLVDQSARTATRWRMPPDNSCGYLPARSQPTRASASRRARAARAVGATHPQAKLDFCRAVIQAKSAYS